MAQGEAGKEPVWTFRASEKAMTRAKDAAQGLGISRSEFIRRAIDAEAKRIKEVA